ncbi:tyrosine-protein phosphatase [Gymnodinialimonas ceratoperidinii]|uniref:Tyrosine-protein phosphatase n=1 Tax=Gymnodinialimonas ceratoperidinii TaxID=2856823 RepID=A0A8F6Y8P6_9RHOB|nr:tyrosine-protein phosphatase [Gymnodinialimonas ceratoperidinii]QXT38124.1 tyrosine-protein phosphatase [Gymnodinialimonas ceratoperidinii]
MSQPPPPSAALAWFQYWLKDHGALRALWRNFHKLDDDVWRHNHPSPKRLARLKEKGAVSVLSLRGSSSDHSQREAAICAELGLNFRGLSLRAVRLPQRKALLELIAALRDMPKPLVIHCKSGADRTGLASVIYLHVFKNVPLAEAREQLGMRFIHNPYGRARIVNVLLDAYAAAHETTGIGFEEWVRTVYDPDALTT